MSGLKHIGDKDIAWLSTIIQGEKFMSLPGIVYRDTHNITNLPEGKFVLVTHNSDVNVTTPPSENVIKWFAQNVNIVHPKIVSIPIGLENNKWYPYKKKKMASLLRHPKRVKNLAYMNFNLRGGRINLYNKFNKSWVTRKKGKNGQDFDDYIFNVYNHKFVFCPEGNGIDTHRTWETLYMGSIPIEKRNINNQFYTDLPICFVDRWEDVTRKFLDREYDRITSSEWNMDKLKFSYWRDKIIKK